MRYHFITLGCQMNRSDSERVRTVMDAAGGQWTESEGEAEVLGIVACSVRQKAIDKVYHRIRHWNAWKRTRPLLTFVSGCMLPADQEKFLKLFDLVFTMNELPRLPELLRTHGVVTPLGLRVGPRADEAENVRPTGEPVNAPASAPGSVVTLDALRTRRPRPPAGGAPTRPVVDGLWQLAATPASAFEAYVPIQNGCDKFCTFCAVPYTRGREVSRRSTEILAEVDGLLARGYRAITLLGQNVNSYGRDRPGEERTFAELLGAIGERGRAHRFWLYFTSPHPRDMTPEVLETMAAHACLARQVHLPLQSGDDKVLLRMNRQHGLGQYRAIVADVRRLMPEATLFTDIIVGFSGETETQFQNTLKAVNEFRYNMIYAAMYSPRPGAASSRWPDDVPQEEKRRRLGLMNAALLHHASAWNAAQVGRRVPVLVTGRDPRHQCLTALTEGRIHVRLAIDEPAWIGRFVEADITAAAGLSLAAEPAAEPAAVCV